MSRIVEPGAGGVPQTVASGAAHFGISVQEVVIPAREQDVPVVSIAAVIEHNTSSLIALGDEGISPPGRPRREDLRRLGRPA